MPSPEEEKKLQGEETASAEVNQEATGKVETYRPLFEGEKVKLGKDKPQVELVPVNVPGMIESSSNQMQQTDHAEAARASEMIQREDDGTAVETIEKQLDASKAKGNLTLLFSEVCRQFGEVYAAKGEMNMAKFGNQVDGEGGNYIIPRSRGGEMQSRLRDMSGSLGEAGGSFHIEAKNTLDKEDGFEAVYRYEHNGVQHEAKMNFFYFDDEKKNAGGSASKQETKKQEEQKPEFVAPPVAQEDDDGGANNVVSINSIQRKKAGNKEESEALADAA